MSDLAPIVAALLETDALTPNDGETYYPAYYVVYAADVEYLVKTVLDLADETPHCQACGMYVEEPDEEIAPGDMWMQDPTSPRRCPGCHQCPPQPAPTNSPNRRTSTPRRV